MIEFQNLENKSIHFLQFRKNMLAKMMTSINFAAPKKMTINKKNNPGQND
jgi:hypothetical protein